MRNKQTSEMLSFRMLFIVGGMVESTFKTSSAKHQKKNEVILTFGVIDAIFLLIIVSPQQTEYPEELYFRVG